MRTLLWSTVGVLSLALAFEAKLPEWIFGPMAFLFMLSIFSLIWAICGAIGRWIRNVAGYDRPVQDVIIVEDLTKEGNK